MNRQGPAQTAPGGLDRERDLAIPAFIQQQGDAGTRFAAGTVSAREAAPCIIAGISVVAIGGFSGNDPIFTLSSFRAMAERGGLRYFLMPGQQLGGGPPGDAQQQPIISYIQGTWRDVSEGVGLPRGSLLRYGGP